MKCVYFARVVDTDGPIKIGCSEYPLARCKQLGSDLAAKIEVIAEVPGDFILERNLHLKFAAHRADGPVREGRSTPVPGAKEWFAAVPALLKIIEEARLHNRITLRKVECRERIFAERYLAGETLQEIAEDFGVTRERVRQILRKMGVPSRGTLTEHRRPKRYRHADRIREQNAAINSPEGSPCSLMATGCTSPARKLQPTFSTALE